MRLVLFTGKGGVGKTTASAAFAVHAARCGLRTLVLSADPAHSLGDALGVPLAAVPSRVAPRLHAQQVDPRDRSWDEVQRYLMAVLDQLGVDPLSAAELTELPGAQDILSLMDVRDQVRGGAWDLVVVDCAPSAETLRLLAVPEVLTRYLDRLLPMERRIARLLGGALRSRREGGLEPPADTVVEAAERFTTELAGLQAVLRDPATSVRLVMTPESVVLAETRRTWTALALHGFAVDAVVANRVLEGGDPWRDRWAGAHAVVLAEADTSFAPVPVQRVAYAEAEPVGVEALAHLASATYGPPSDPAGAALIAPPAAAPPYEIDREAEGFVLRLALPLASRSELELGRQGDDLVVTVSGRRRVVSLPSALRRCEVGGASLREGSLAIRFTPDPAQWRSF